MKKLALVTGSYRGLGLETVKQLLELEYEVILTSRSKVKAKEALASLEHFGKYLHFHELDVADQASVDACFAWVQSSFGRLDVLVNNAGINYDTWHNAIDADLQEVAQTMDANFMGAWRTAKAAIPLMKAYGYGRIVNVSSGAGAITEMAGGTPGYSVSKAAMNVLTIKLATDLSGTGILVNSVCPGWVRTDMGGGAAPRSVEEGAQGIVWAATLPDSSPSGGFFRDGNRVEW